MAKGSNHFDEGLQHFEAGDYDEAEASLKQVGGEPEQRCQALTLLGRLYLITERLPEAEQVLRQAQQFRRSHEGYMVLGEVLLKQDKYAEAEAAFQEALRRENGDPEASIQLGHVYAAQDRFADAIRAYEQALLRDSTSIPARFHLALSLLSADNMPRAATQLHYLLQRDPEYVPAILLMGDMAFIQADYRQAVVEYCRAMELENLDASALERLGQSFNALSDFGQALKAFETSIKLHPDYWGCYLEAARICESGKWLRKAKRYFQAVVSVPEYQEEAEAAIARIDAHFAKFDLSEGTSEAPPPPEASFTPPETLNRGTGMLDPSVVPWAGASNTGNLDGWVSTQTGKLPPSSPKAAASSTPETTPRKLLEATNELLPEGLKRLTGLFKRPKS
jgi:tetratricopeptide (TPR) repeat protein